MAKWGRRKSSIIKLLEPLFKAQSLARLEIPSLTEVKVAATERPHASSSLPAALIVVL